MSTSRRWASRLLPLFFVLCTHVGAADLRLVTEENAPSSFTQNGRLTGLYVEVAQEIQRRIGNKDTIEVLPWARGYQIALKDPNVVLFPTTRSRAREPLFQWVGPVGTAITAFYAKRGAGIRINTLEDARAAPSILVPRGWYTQDQLRGLGFTNLELTTTPQQMVAMLLAGRAPLMYTMQTGLGELLEQSKARDTDIEQVYIVDKAQGYLAFSIKTPPEVIRQWQAALDGMKDDGSFATLYKRWFPGEPPPGIKPDPDVWPNPRKPSGYTLPE